MGFGTLLCTVGFERRREGKECFAERTQGARRAGLRNDGWELAACQGILFLLAWQLFAVQKACQSPHSRRAAIPGFPHRCATGPRVCAPRLAGAKWLCFAVFLLARGAKPRCLAGRDGPPTKEASLSPRPDVVGGASRPASHRLESLCHRTSGVRAAIGRCKMALFRSFSPRLRAEALCFAGRDGPPTREASLSRSPGVVGGASRPASHRLQSLCHRKFL